MAKTQKTKKQKLNSKPEKNIKKPKPKTAQQPQPPTTTTPESDSASDSDELSSLLEAYSKEQLIELISTAALKSPSLHSHIVSVADLDISHRKIFIHGLAWDTTRHSLISSFEPFGDIEEVTVVTDRITGKSKGFAFITFKTRKGASKALKNPRKEINNRMAWCQLASVGPLAAAASAAVGGKDKDENLAGRRVYVANVGRDVEGERLRVYFARFGEIEAGPIGFDVNTGKSRGFAIFVYRTVEGAKTALEEPYKMFEGNQLHCRKALDMKNKNQPQPPQQQQQQQALAAAAVAAAAAQNMALFGQHPALVGAFNPGMLNYGVFNHPGVGGLGAGSQSVLGAYGTGQGLHHVYPSVHHQGAGRGQGGGSFAGYPSYM